MTTDELDRAAASTPEQYYILRCFDLLPEPYITNLRKHLNKTRFTCGSAAGNYYTKYAADISVLATVKKIPTCNLEKIPLNIINLWDNILDLMIGTGFSAYDNHCNILCKLTNYDMHLMLTRSLTKRNLL